MTRSELIMAAADELLQQAADKAHTANGEVDKDGIDDFIGIVVQGFAAEVRAMMEAKNKY